MSGPVSRFERQIELFLARRSLPGILGPVDGDLRPADTAEAYVLVRTLNERLAGPDNEIVGYKIGCTSKRAQTMLGTDGPVWACLFEKSRASDIHAGLGRTSGRAGLECEVAIKLAADIENPDCTDAELLASIASCAASCEIVENRYGNPASVGAQVLVVDGFMQSGFVTAPLRTDWAALDFAALKGKIAIDGKVVCEATSDTVLGSPLQSLRWLATELVKFGEILRAGQVVLTGSIGNAVWLDTTPKHIMIEVEGLGGLQSG